MVTGAEVRRGGQYYRHSSDQLMRAERARRSTTCDKEQSCFGRYFSTRLRRTRARALRPEPGRAKRFDRNQASGIKVRALDRDWLDEIKLGDRCCRFQTRRG